MQSKPSSNRALVLKGYGMGAALAACLLAVLLIRWQLTGTPTPPSLNAARFTVAVMSGPKQAAQTAPENADQVADSVAPAPAPENAPAVTAERETSLPEAVKAAADTAPSPEVTKPVEVLPPAQVSMPGGQLMAEDASIGNDIPNPFEIKPREVFIRLLVNEKGQVVRFGVIRSGGDPMRDNLILKAMRSRTYDTSQKGLIRIDGKEPIWQLDMVLPYGNNDFLP